MTADEIKAAYADQLKETIIVRRYTGTGVNRAWFEAEARGKAWGYSPNELVGSIQQGDRRVLVLIEDLIARGFSLPVTANDKVKVSGKELAIVSPGTRKAPDGTPIVCDLQVRG